MSFMAAHPDGFGSLNDAADIIAEYNPGARDPKISTACTRSCGNVATDDGSGAGTQRSSAPTSMSCKAIS